MTAGLPPHQMSGSQEEFRIHLTQALGYLHSCHRHMKTWAALFIGTRRAGGATRARETGAGLASPTHGLCPYSSHAGYTVCYHPQAVSHLVSHVDLNLLLRSK